MVFNFNINTLPVVTDLYKIERKTVWQQADNNNIIVIILDGECIFTINNVDYSVKRGDIFFIPKGQDYIRKPKGDISCTFYYLHFITAQPIATQSSESIREKVHKIRTDIDNEMIENNYIPTYHSSEIYISYTTSTGKSCDYVFDLLEKALSEANLFDIESQLIMSLCASYIFAIATRITLNSLMLDNETVLEEKIPPQLKKVMLYIRQNYKKKLSLSIICSYCNISPQHMIRLFNTTLNITPTQYINKLKISYSKELMRKTSMSMKEIAFELGFDNQHYFSRLFCKIEGVYPTTFKKKFDIPESAYIK